MLIATRRYMVLLDDDVFFTRATKLELLLEQVGMRMVHVACGMCMYATWPSNSSSRWAWALG